MKVEQTVFEKIQNCFNKLVNAKFVYHTTTFLRDFILYFKVRPVQSVKS